MICLTSSTLAEIMAVLPIELACSILCSSVGANWSCAASVPPVCHSAVLRLGSVMKASFSRNPRACSSEKSLSYTQHTAVADGQGLGDDTCGLGASPVTFALI